MRHLCTVFGACLELGSGIAMTCQTSADGYGLLGAVLGALSLSPLVFAAVDRWIDPPASCCKSEYAA